MVTCRFFIYCIFGDQKKFTYYAPGASRIAEKASAPVKGRSHKIETTIVQLQKLGDMYLIKGENRSNGRQLVECELKLVGI